MILLPLFVLLFYLEMRSLPLWFSICMGLMLWLSIVVLGKLHAKLDDKLCRMLDERRAKLKK